MNKESIAGLYYTLIIVASTTNRWLVIMGQNHEPEILLHPLKSAVSGPIPIVVVVVVEPETMPLFTDRLQCKIQIYHSN